MINLVDTPGHVDFTGKVTRALRIIDGALILVDAVEGVMVQTETVTRQALQEFVRPVLFINKIDRLIRELRLGSEQIEKKLSQIINDFNTLIDMYADRKYRDAWKVSASKGSVAFGSALHRWGFTVPTISEQDLRFRNIVRFYEEDEIDKLHEVLPVHKAIFNMIVYNLPSPIEAQRYRIPKIWRGTIESEIGSAMMECDEEGPSVIYVNKVLVDPHAKLISVGRIFSGTVREGSELYLVSAEKKQRIQQVNMYMGDRREVVKEVSAGNIVGLLCPETTIGETIVEADYWDKIVPFEEIRYISEPVVTIAVEAEFLKDLPRLVKAMEKLSVQDPNLSVIINPETGEYLLSGMGELHLEIAIKDIQKTGIRCIASPPTVVYRETVKKAGKQNTARSLDKKELVTMFVEPIDEKTVALFTQGIISPSRDRKYISNVLRNKAGWPEEETERILSLNKYGNLFMTKTDLEDLPPEVKETIISEMNRICSAGPLSEEPLRGIRIEVVNLEIGEATPKSPTGIASLIRNATIDSFLSGSPTLLEPIYKIQINIPSEYIGVVTNLFAQRRGHIQSMKQTDHIATIVGRIPVAESFGLANELRSKTSGRAFWQTQFETWQEVHSKLLSNTVGKIRKRKGLPPPTETKNEQS
ncbi:MAG: GTP-binding protein [Promethearchaeota archaeon]